MYGPEVMTAYRYYWHNGLSEFRSIGSEDEITLDNLGPDRLILGEPDECGRGSGAGARPFGSCVRRIEACG